MVDGPAVSRSVHPEGTMTTIQQVHWKLEMDYLGHPYYVSGNAIFHALAHQLPTTVRRTLRVSHGMFVPGQYGTFPEDHSQSGSHPAFGNSLREVQAYQDLFVFRDPYQPWLIESRPRDALNTHDLRIQAGQPAMANKTILNLPDANRFDTRTTNWFVSAYLSCPDESLLPLSRKVLDDVQFGGKRNYGYGTATLVGSQTVDTTTLDYSALEQADRFVIKLTTPFVLASTYPNADHQEVPWWWNQTRDELGERTERIVEQREVYRLTTVDHGQLVEYCGDRPVETAKQGIGRIGTHSKYGFGEFRVLPVERADTVQAA